METKDSTVGISGEIIFLKGEGKTYFRFKNLSGNSLV